MKPSQKYEQEPQGTWSLDSLESGNTTHALSSNRSSMRQQQRRSKSKKYTIKTVATSVPSAATMQQESTRASPTKRQRGGSDFTLPSVSNRDGITTASTRDRRKRRRINRNRAMAAHEFDSILSQINTTGAL